MSKLAYDSVRFVWRLILRWSPTCDLQWELGRRTGVETVQLAPYEDRTFSASGPATVTINRD